MLNSSSSQGVRRVGRSFWSFTRDGWRWSTCMIDFFCFCIAYRFIGLEDNPWDRHGINFEDIPLTPKKAIKFYISITTALLT